MRRPLVILALLALALVSLATAATIRVSVPSAGMTFALPSSWRQVDARTATSAAAKALAKENPQLGEILRQVSQPNSVIKLFAYDPKGAATFATNVNVVVSPLPPGITLDQYAAAARAEMAALPSRVGAPTIYLERIPAGPAVRTHVQIAIRANGKRIITDINQWALLRPGKSIVLSFTTTPAKRRQYLKTFTTSARSVRFG